LHDFAGAAKRSGTPPCPPLRDLALCTALGAPRKQNRRLPPFSGRPPRWKPPWLP